MHILLIALTLAGCSHTPMSFIDDFDYDDLTPHEKVDIYHYYNRKKFNKLKRSRGESMNGSIEAHKSHK